MQNEYPLLDNLSGPESLRSMDVPTLNRLADEVRDGLVRTIAKVGGHFAPNLGVIELTIAMYHAYGIPEDKIIWDVGHQCYPHKMLTGRWKQLSSIKQYGGISGYLRRDESKYDLFGAGHASTSLSAALGFAKARDLRGSKEHVLAVIGDGSLTGGMALEAMLNIGDQKTDMVVVLNDNNMSIAENVGALATMLAKLRLNPRFQKAQSAFKSSIPKEALLYKAASGARHAATHLVAPANTGLFFEELGFQYIGPLDGHDIGFLAEVFEEVKRLKGPVLLHVNTTKGKGYVPAEGDQRTWHAVSAFNIEDGNLEKKASGVSYTQAFVESLNEVAVNHPEVVAITAAMPDGTGLAKFAEKFPERFFDVGIAEQHAVTFAAGLAAGGFRPVCAIYSTFLQRAYDQIIHDVCLQNLPVVFCIDRAGLVGDDGATHHGAMDIAYMRCIPGMSFMAPCDTAELREMVRYALTEHQGPIAIRYPRGSTELLEPKPQPIRHGLSQTLMSGGDVALLAVGPMVNQALEAARILRDSHKIDCTVVNVRWIKPLDIEMLTRVAESARLIVTLEDGVITGGFGSAVTEAIQDMGKHHIAVKRIGLPDSYVEHGPIPKLQELCGMDAKSVVQTVINGIREIVPSQK
jgi:1-deoxy-D-xylulose-5-phosphate synthase